MSDKTFADRFQRLEIPEDSVDFSFVETQLSLPRPLPLESEPILVMANGRAFIPGSDTPDGHTILLYDQCRILVELGSFAQLEASWRHESLAKVQRQATRFKARIPAAVLREPSLMAEASQMLWAEGPGPDEPIPEAHKAIPAGKGGLEAVVDDSVACRHLVGHSRFLRIHDKLYDLVDLREYIQIFERAIEPAMMRTLMEVPLTSPSEVYLELIEASLDQFHPRARSPLRNKISTSRVVFNGVTLLPIYSESAGGLFEGYGELLERKLKLEALEPQ